MAEIRPLTTMGECRQVARLERAIWSYADAEDVIPPPLLIASIRRGAILLGAFDEAGRMQGFVYSMPGIRDARLTQWSHLLGVAPEARDRGLGAQLKLAQREAALEAGVELIEWTFDPLQALNAHFNFGKLGAVAEEYEENVYGESESPLHRGAPTDRLIAEWHLTEPHVERRLAAWGSRSIRDRSFPAVVVNPSDTAVPSPRPGRPNLEADDRRLLVEIPTGFTEMLLADSGLALAWRLHTREVFETYLERGYRVVDFFLSREACRGHYLLAQSEGDH